MEDHDHRKLAARLGLYHIEEEAPGMPFWHPDGHALYRQIEDYVRRLMGQAGYMEVRTPQVLPRSLWERSGHWEKFAAGMFRVADSGGKEMALKPMSCPCHVAIFNRHRKSWRDLPYRLSEFGSCHRDEPSGSMHGLMRTRAFEQDDAHVFCERAQVEDEVLRFYGLLDRAYRDLGFPSYKVALSTRPDVRAGDEDDWDWAEGALARVAAAAGLSPVLQPGEGAFYGPKLEFVLFDSQGREWQCGTVQVDLVLPKRLDASFVGRAGKAERPVMVHHAVLGSLGRFIAILLEHHGGRLPFWLAPVQVEVLPVSARHAEAASRAAEAFAMRGLRVRMSEEGSLGRRLADERSRCVPVHAVVGNREASDGSVALSMPDGERDVLPVLDAGNRLAGMSRSGSAMPEGLPSCPADRESNVG